MAFNRHHHNPARQHSVLGTGSSHSCLDGVPFKISTIFRPLPQPGLPSELFDGVPRSAFHQEYDYETEEGVLAWARAREEAKIKAQAERERAERARQALAAAAQSSSSSESEDEYGLVASHTPGGGGGGGGGSGTRNTAALPQQPAARPPWQLPLPASVGSTILTPVPIHTTKAKVQSPLAPRTHVDLALFEQEGDPFDNLELQTIDDMEELRTLLELVTSEPTLGGEPLPGEEDSQPMYSNSEMVNSQLGEGGHPPEAEGRSEASSSKDKIYVNVTVRSGMEGSTSSDQTGEECNTDARSALARSTDAGSELVRSMDAGSALIRSADAGSALVRSTGGASALVRSTGGRSALVRSSEAGSALIRSTGGGSALVRSTDAGSVMARSADARSAMVRSSDAGSALIRSMDAGSALVHSTGAGSALVRSTDAGSALVRSMDAGSALVRSTDAGSVLIRSADATSALDAASLSGSVNKPDRTSKTSCDFVIEPTGDGDYVMIRSDYSQKSVSSQHDSPSVYANISGSGTDDIDPEPEDESQGLYTNSEVFTSTQPTVQPRVKSLFGDQAPASASGKRSSVVFNPTVTYTLPRTSGHAEVMDDRMSQSAYAWSDSSAGAWGLDLEPSGTGGTKDSHTYTNVPFTDSRSVMVASTPAFSNVFYSSEARSQSQSASMDQMNSTADDDRPIFSQAATKDNHMYSNMPCSDVNSIMTVSMPAFSDNFYGNFPHQESVSTSPGNIMSPSGGVLRNARSDFDLSNYSPQPWNPYKPLPPPPSSDLRSSSSSTESLPTEPSQNPSPLVLSPSPGEFGAAAASRLVGEENDPFLRLSSQAKTFVNKLASMGFSRSRVSRAVEKFGNDEKEVLDHLFNVDKLVEKKFSPSLAEMSLQLFKNDIQKAEVFLDLFQQFRELGFASERIQTALVKHKLDRDKALDYLTT